MVGYASQSQNLFNSSHKVSSYSFKHFQRDAVERVAHYLMGKVEFTELPQSLRDEVTLSLKNTEVNTAIPANPNKSNSEKPPLLG